MMVLESCLLHHASRSIADSQIISNVATGSDNSLWLELARGLPAAIVALIIAVITLRQYRVARAKLRLDLFDKRYPIYLETWTILSETATRGTRVKNYGLGNPFSNFIPQARFLFGKDIEDYLLTAVAKWTALWAVEGETGGQGITAQESSAKRSELQHWFFKEASTGSKELFGRYLEFEKW